MNMKVFMKVSIAVLALISSTSAKSNNGREARGGTRLTGRQLKSKSKGKGKGGPSDCCEFIEELLELDQACKEIVMATETEIVCEETFGIVPGKGKGGKGDTPAEQLADAVEEFATLIEDFQADEFASDDVTQEDCFGGDPIPLSTFGDWCTRVTIDGSDPPTIMLDPLVPVTDLGTYVEAYVSPL